MIRPDSQIVPSRGEHQRHDRPAGHLEPERPPRQPERRDHDQHPDDRPAADQRDRVGPPDQGLRVGSQHGQDAHVGRSRIMPPPVSMHGIEQRQPVDGQVAVEMVLGVEDRAARGSGPSRQSPRPSTTQGQRGRRSIAAGGSGGSWRDWSRHLVADSDEEVGHRATEAGKLGEVFDDLVLAARRWEARHPSGE